MTALVITRGYPGSGKTTWARSWVEADSANRLRVNRDDLRMTTYGTYTGLEYRQERALSQIQHAMVKAALRAGKDVVVDDTNLVLRYARAWANLAAEVGAEFDVLDFKIPASQCIARDAARGAAGGRQVGERVIVSFAERFPLSRWPEVAADEKVEETWAPYKPIPLAPKAWLVDIDGTLAERGERSPFDWARVGEDTPVQRVIDVVRALSRASDIIVMSGRSEECRTETLDWLVANWVPVHALYMRAADDFRKDSVVKDELFRLHVEPRWNVQGVLDDRQQVVDMWRAKGLTCLQVAPSFD